MQDFDEEQDRATARQLAAMDAFISAIGASDEHVPDFERLTLREVEAVERDTTAPAAQ